jgi:DNA invertase Pin-like site-specific DNA recombinase
MYAAQRGSSGLRTPRPPRCSSGTGLQARPGFGQLLAAVCQGQVGVVIALEASRLARNNRDWHHLIDLCALTETLLMDDDGVYDARQLNDR